MRGTLSVGFVYTRSEFPTTDFVVGKFYILLLNFVCRKIRWKMCDGAYTRLEFLTTRSYHTFSVGKSDRVNGYIKLLCNNIELIFFFFVILGGHINPAVSFAMCLTGRLDWVKLPFYVTAQFLGAITGSALVFGVYYDALIKYTGGVFTVDGPNATAHIFATYPAPYLSTINGLADQILSTALLLIMVFAIFDKKNLAAPKGLEPVAVGLLILLLGLCLGMNCGGAMNPARDLGPRVFTAAAGWGYEVFT
ncbi:hypothetical protein AB205_0031470 [Aquarana catesbeiana]|uniref:Aquaporin-3 n=1 Tax=Aquarana catesbeiana TaxID=8400 RepID=A0A2G9P936_AQUCT|nr:hypothetical protein AB205_0031470 [Aquarana catesbeiana]